LINTKMKIRKDAIKVILEKGIWNSIVGGTMARWRYAKDSYNHLNFQVNEDMLIDNISILI
jgi:hypothetical protein